MLNKAFIVKYVWGILAYAISGRLLMQFRDFNMLVCTVNHQEGYIAKLISEYIIVLVFC